MNTAAIATYMYNIIIKIYYMIGYGNYETRCRTLSSLKVHFDKSKQICTKLRIRFT